MSSDPPTVTPGSVDELVVALRDTEARGAKVAIAGAGSKATWGGVQQPVDVALNTAALTGVVEHAPGDLVVTVRAGTPLEQLQAELAPHDQWLALDPPHMHTTIGGLLAAATSGPHRLRYGTPRDQLIGIHVALADGTLAKSGGKVVKNVAGYDLGKLFTGSYGTLGVIVSATFKLQPRPPARRFVTVRTAAPGEAWAALTTISAAPSAVEWCADELHVLVEAAPSAVEAIATTVANVLGTTEVSERTPLCFGAPPWGPHQVAIKMTHRLSGTDAVLTAATRILRGAQATAQVGSGVMWFGWEPGSEDDVAGTLGELRAAAASYDGTAVIVDAPEHIKRTVDVWGPVQGLALMRRIKDQFDPDHRLNPGRFVDGI